MRFQPEAKAVIGETPLRPRVFHPTDASEALEVLDILEVLNGL